MEMAKLYEMPAKEIVTGYHAKFVHSENVTIAYWDIEEGHSLPEHAHPHEQVLNLLEGRFEVTLEGESAVLEAGSVVVIPSNAVHSGRSLAPCRIIDVFYPVREDYVGK